MVRRVPSYVLALLLGALVGAVPFIFAAFTYARLPGALPPIVTLEETIGDQGLAEVVVLRSEPPRPLRQFSAVLTLNEVGFGSLRWLDDPGGSLPFSDMDDDGQLTPGDRFSSFVTLDGRFELQVFWRGTPVASATWNVVRPTVNLGPVVVQYPVVTVDVQSAAPRVNLTEFSAVLAGYGTPVVISPLGIPTGPPFAFEDRDGDSRLSTGDRFTSWHDEPESYWLQVLWRGMDLTGLTWTLSLPDVAVTVSIVGPSTSWANVTRSAPPHPCGEYEAWVEVDSLWVDSISDLCNATGMNGILSAQDRDGDGNLTLGDRLVVEAGPGAELALTVFWKQHALLRETWTV